jgi:uncharacterized membrane protein (UPF0136 family)
MQATLADDSPLALQKHWFVGSVLIAIILSAIFVTAVAKISNYTAAINISNYVVSFGLGALLLRFTVVRKWVPALLMVIPAALLIYFMIMVQTFNALPDPNFINSVLLSEVRFFVCVAVAVSLAFTVEVLAYRAVTKLSLKPTLLAAVILVPLYYCVAHL